MERQQQPVRTLAHLGAAAAVECESPETLEVTESSIQQWAEIAASQAILDSMDDPPGFVATVSGVKGAWGFGDSERAAIDELRSVLVGWVTLKLEDGDDDIPNMEGVQLVTGR